MKRILVTGSLGQVGTELVLKLRKEYGNKNVMASDIRKPDNEAADSGPFEILDVRDGRKVYETAKNHGADTIIHLAALLSATAEKKPLDAWDLNMGGLLNVLETARDLDLKVFVPSSIGAFGPSTPKKQTPQVTIQRPTTMYGINKAAGELLCDYYFYKYGVDTRGVRFPGLISYAAPPGGGTTDYAVEIFFAAVKKGSYTCYIRQTTKLDMMYMPDAIQSVIRLMEADPGRLTARNAYNITAMSIAPADLSKEIKTHLPDFKMKYSVDPVRQAIAESWPDSLDDSAARQDWGFHPAYHLSNMAADMLEKIKNRPQ